MLHPYTVYTPYISALLYVQTIEVNFVSYNAFFID